MAEKNLFEEAEAMLSDPIFEDKEPEKKSSSSSSSLFGEEDSDSLFTGKTKTESPSTRLFGGEDTDSLFADLKEKQKLAEEERAKEEERKREEEEERKREEEERKREEEERAKEEEEKAGGEEGKEEEGKEEEEETKEEKVEEEGKEEEKEEKEEEKEEEKVAEEEVIIDTEKHEILTEPGLTPFSKPNSYCLYHLSITVGSQKGESKFRFSDFDKANAATRKKNPTEKTPTFVGGGLFESGTKDEVIRDRKDKIYKYLKEISENRKLLSSFLKEIGISMTFEEIAPKSPHLRSAEKIEEKKEEEKKEEEKKEEEKEEEKKEEENKGSVAPDGQKIPLGLLTLGAHVTDLKKFLDADHEPFIQAAEKIRLEQKVKSAVLNEKLKQTVDLLTQLKAHFQQQAKVFDAYTKSLGGVKALPSSDLMESAFQEYEKFVASEVEAAKTFSAALNKTHLPAIENAIELVKKQLTVTKKGIDTKEAEASKSLKKVKSGHSDLNKALSDLENKVSQDGAVAPSVIPSECPLLLQSRYNASKIILRESLLDYNNFLIESFDSVREIEEKRINAICSVVVDIISAKKSMFEEISSGLQQTTSALQSVDSAECWKRFATQSSLIREDAPDASKDSFVANLLNAEDALVIKPVEGGAGEAQPSSVVERFEMEIDGMFSSSNVVIIVSSFGFLHQYENDENRVKGVPVDTFALHNCVLVPVEGKPTSSTVRTTPKGFFSMKKEVTLRASSEEELAKFTEVIQRYLV